MEHTLENKYLSKDKSFISQIFKEDEVDEYTSADKFNDKVQQSLIKESQAITQILNKLLATTQAYESGLSEMEIKQKGIKNLSEAYHLKNGLHMIFDQYIQMPALLDSLLDKSVTPIMNFLQKYVHSHAEDFKQKNFQIPKWVTFQFELVYNMCKVRGYKTIIKFFPHEAADLEPCMNLLANTYNNFAVEEWYNTYILLLWLSIIVLTPFDIATIDSSSENSLIDTLMAPSIECLGQMGKSKEAAALLIGKLLSRPDVAKTPRLRTTVENFVQKMNHARFHGVSQHLIQGLLLSLVSVFKHGDRKELKPLVSYISENVLHNDTIEVNKYVKQNGIYRKLLSKLAQMCGLVLLKPKVVSWRYNRGLRSINDAFTDKQKEEGSKSSQKIDEGTHDEQDDDLEEEDFPILEKLFDSLILCLRDPETSVRWTTAKGIGRMSARLPEDFAQEIVQQIINLFKDSSQDYQDSVMHGACLTLAELSRRGLLKIEKFPSVIPALETAMQYDQNRGNYSIGQNVRDAACYVVWSFARAYSPQIMKPYVPLLSANLVTMSVYDREVNCRRAASAAFQENVGRQGNFPHGIDILTQADYFTLGIRANAYINVAAFIAQYEEYYPSLLNHLVTMKLNHWDPAARSLAAQALSILCVFNSKHIVEDLIPKISKLALSKVLHIRHGGILAMGETLMGISGNSWRVAQEHTQQVLRSMSAVERNIIADSDKHQQFKTKFQTMQMENHLDQLIEHKDSLQRMQSIIKEIEDKKLNRGKGGELMRIAMCHFIKCAALAKLPLEEEHLFYINESLLTNLQHPKIQVQEAAREAFKEFSQFYHLKNEKIKKQIVEKIKSLFDSAVNSTVIETTRGITLGMGVLANQILEAVKPELLSVMMKNSLPKGKDNDQAETRKAAVQGLSEIVVSLGTDNITPQQLSDILVVCMKATDDYAVDTRGDVGSWVRAAAIQTLRKILTQFIQNAPNKINPEIIIDYVCMCLKQLSEKIDKTRQICGTTLQYFLRENGQKKIEQSKEMPYISQILPEFKLLMDVFVENPEILGASSRLVANVDFQRVFVLPWRNPKFTFPQLLKFLDSKTYSQPILQGIIASAGGLTESTLKASLEALSNYLSKKLKSKKYDSVERFYRTLIQIFERNKGNDRVIVPLLKTFQGLFQTGYLSLEGFTELGEELQKLVIAQNRGSKNIVKVIAATGLLAEMTAYKVLIKPCLKSLIFLLYHGYPKVRKTASEKLYTFLITLDDEESIKLAGGSEEQRDNALMILTDTNWTSKISEFGREKKEVLLKIFGFE